eukprot:4137813-Pleurochrysis_carterae.AAC.1
MERESQPIMTGQSNKARLLSGIHRREEIDRTSNSMHQDTTKRRERRRVREVTMSEKRAQRSELHKQYREVARNTIVEEQVIRAMRRKYENQLEQKRQARQARKRLRAKRRAADKKRENEAIKARMERRQQAARKRTQQEEEGREGEVRKRRSDKETTGEQEPGMQGEQTPAAKEGERMRTRSTSHSTRSPMETPEEEADVSIILASERGLP